MKTKIAIMLAFIMLLVGCQQNEETEQSVATLPDVSVNEQALKEFKQKIQSGNANRYEGLQIRNKPLLTPQKICLIHYSMIQVFISTILQQVFVGFMYR